MCTQNKLEPRCLSNRKLSLCDFAGDSFDSSKFKKARWPPANLKQPVQPWSKDEFQDWPRELGPHNVSVLPRRTKHAWLCSSFKETHVTETIAETQEQPGFTPLQLMWIFVRGPSSHTHTPFISLCSPMGAILGEAEEFTSGLSLSISHQQSPFKEKNQPATGDVHHSISAGELCEAGRWRGVILHWWSCAGNIPMCGYSHTRTIPSPFPFFLPEMACVVLSVYVCTKVWFFPFYSGSTKHIYIQMRQHLVGVTAFGVLFWAGVHRIAKTSHFLEQMNATQDYPLTHLKTA